MYCKIKKSKLELPATEHNQDTRKTVLMASEILFKDVRTYSIDIKLTYKNRTPSVAKATHCKSYPSDKLPSSFPT